MSLVFADGKTLSFNETAAQDIGDYIGPFVHQKCRRQRASGNNDYRDGFVVFFRPDADGSRDEVVIEFGTEYLFPADAPPILANGVEPTNLFTPPVPKTTKTGGAATTQTGQVSVFTSYVTPLGESQMGGYAVVHIVAGDRITVASPPPRSGATHYNVYMILRPSPTNPAVVLQTARPVAIGTDWTEPETGIVLSGKKAPTVPTFAAYTATISGGTLTAPVTISAPMHWGAARWRWQSAQRPIIRRLPQLIAMKATLPLATDLAYGGWLRTNEALWTGPMGIGSLAIGMPGAGDRGDIGLITDWMAAWLMTGDRNAEIIWRANAEAVGTMPFWIRDTETGTFVDVLKHPYMAFSDSSPRRYTIPVAAPAGRASNYFSLDMAHMPEASFLSWLVTDDPYFLEGAQAAANFAILFQNAQRLHNKLPALVATGQPRAMAWGWRNLFQMAGFAPENTSSWLQPRAYWRSLIPDQVAFAQRYIDATASPATTVFKLIPQTQSTAAFMLDYICLVIGWIKWTRLFPEFDAAVEYAAHPRIAMSDPANSYGWDHRQPEPYYMPVVDARKGAAATGRPAYTYNIPASPDTPTSWKELWECYLKWAPTARDERPWTDPSTWPADGLIKNTGYYPLIRAALAALSLGGVKGAREGHDWMKHQLDLLGSHVKGGRFKWAVPPKI